MNWFAAGLFVVLMLIVMTSQIVRLLGEAAIGVLASGAVWTVMGFTAIRYLPTLFSLMLFITVLSIILNIVVSFVVVISKSLTVFYFFLAAIPVAVIIMYAFRSRIKKYNSDFRSEMEETSARVMEMVELIPITRALEDTETKKMDNQLEHVAKTGLKLDMIQTFFGSVSWVAFQLFQVICLAFTSFMAAQKKISIGEVVMYQTYFGTIVNQISSILGLLPIISKGLESVDSVGDILLSNDVEDSGSKEKLERVNGEISFEHMNFRYRDGTEDVLHDLNLHLKAGGPLHS